MNPSLRKYWLLFAIVLLLTAIVGMSQYAESSKQRYEESTENAQENSVAKDNNNKAAYSVPQPYKPPVWTKYVAFPEGVGAWAVILTLVAIVWQSIETRAAAEASSKQAEIANKVLHLQFRPELRVRSVSLEEEGEFFHVTIVVPNRGGLPAYIHEGKIALSWLYKEPSEKEIKYMTIGSSTVQPGSQNSFGMSLRGNDLLSYKHYVSEAIKYPADPLIRLRCQGEISYFDNSGAYRYLGFSRTHDVATGQWITSTDTHREYYN